MLTAKELAAASNVDASEMGRDSPARLEQNQIGFYSFVLFQLLGAVMRADAACLRA